MKKEQKIDEITLSYFTNVQTPKENRSNIIAFFLILLDVCGVLFLLADPMIPFLLWAGIIPVILLHLVALPVIIDPYRFELSYYWLIGLYGIINTYVYFLVIQKLIYLNLSLQSYWPIVIGAVLLVALVVAVNVFNIHALYSGLYARLQKKGTKINLSPIIAASSIGYIIGQFLLSSFFVQSVKVIVLIFVLSVLSIVTAYFSTYLHKYFYLKKHSYEVKRIYPEFGMPKKLRRGQ